MIVIVHYEIFLVLFILKTKHILRVKQQFEQNA